MNQPKIVSWEEFAAPFGVISPYYTEPGLHCPAAHVSKRNRARVMREFNKRMMEYQDLRDKVKRDYEREVLEGRIRKPYHQEHIIRRAQGHPDNQSTQAARRICEKNGWNYDP